MKTGPTRTLCRTAIWTSAMLGLLVGSVHAADPIGTDGSGAIEAPTNAPSWTQRETLSGDWDGSRSALAQRGIVIKPRLTQFVQGMSAGEGPHGAEYGGKADLLVAADLGKLGLWNGFSMTVHAEANFGNSVNGRGGVAIPVNTALEFPGIDGSDAYDVSSAFFTQRFGEGVSVVFGKINMIDMAQTRDFMGGAGIDAFWNLTFAAPPTGTVPPYLFGVLARFQTEAATYHLWVYDPVSVANKSVFDDPFGSGVNIRATVDFPVTLAGLPGHQGFTALYSTQDGTDLASLDGIHVPSPVPGAVQIKDSRYYFAWIFDQQLYRSPGSAAEGFGLFGQLGVSDGNPNGLRWSLLAGIGGKGLVPGRSNDNWGVGYYYDSFSQDLKDALAPAVTMRNEQGLELFYNFALTPWCVLGLDLQVNRPALASATAVLPGMRMVMRF
jgi:porin